MAEPPAPRRPTPAGELGTSVQKPDAGVAVLTVDGEVDTLTAPPLEQALQELVTDPSATLLVVDLTDVTFLASSGLAVLIRAAHRAAERDLPLHLVAGTRSVRRPLEVTGSDQLFVLHDDRVAALATAIEPRA